MSVSPKCPDISTGPLVTAAHVQEMEQEETFAEGPVGKWELTPAFALLGWILSLGLKPFLQVWSQPGRKPNALAMSSRLGWGVGTHVCWKLVRRPRPG